MSYSIFTQSVRGSSHIRKDIPREDFGIKLEENDIKVFAVADGHGDSRCCRAHIGSELICKVAVNELSEFAKTIKAESWENRLFDSDECRKLVETLVTSIIGKWGNATNDEFEHNPLSEMELSAASDLNADFSSGMGVEKLYGTTLIAGLATDDYLLLLQQGDGRCDVFDEEGKVSQPIPWDDRCVGTGTTSVCDNDAIQSTRYHIIDLKKTPVIACIAGSDGVEDSFPMSMEKVHAYYRELIIYCCQEGVDRLERYLETELSELSQNGSADDVTVSGIIDIERCRPFLNRFKEENSLVDISEDIKAVNMKISSVEDGGKYSHFRKIYEETSKEYEEIRGQCREAAEEYQALKRVVDAQESYSDGELDAGIIDTIKSLLLPKKSVELLKADLTKREAHLISLKKRLDDIEKEKLKAEQEYEPLRQKYEDLLNLREEKQKELTERTNEIKQKTKQEMEVSRLATDEGEVSEEP